MPHPFRSLAQALRLALPFLGVAFFLYALLHARDFRHWQELEAATEDEEAAKGQA